MNFKIMVETENSDKIILWDKNQAIEFIVKSKNIPHGAAENLLMENESLEINDRTLYIHKVNNNNDDRDESIPRCAKPYCYNPPLANSRFCCLQHEVDYLNVVRCSFWPDQKQDAELLSSSSLSQLLSWDVLNTDQKMFKINLLMDTCSRLMALVYSEKNRDEIKSKAETEQTIKEKMKAYVNSKGELTQAQVELERAKELVKKSGEKVSKDGCCLSCKKPSIAKFCSDKCKALGHWTKIGVSYEEAEKMLAMMQTGI